MPPTYTRQQLYDLVWSTPIATLARDLGISGVGLAKLCRRHKIPCPPRGYWAKLQHGKVVRRPALPKSEDEKPVTIRPHEPGPARPKPDPSSPAVFVSDKLRDPHRLIKSTQAALRPRRSNAKVDYSGVLDLVCAASSLDRALRILDALIKAIEARGGSVTIDKHPHHRQSTLAALGGDPVPISMREKYDQKPNPEYGGKGDWRTNRNKFIQSASGRLELRIGEYSYPGTQKSRADGKRLKLEDRLGAIVEEIAQRSVTKGLVVARDSGCVEAHRRPPPRQARDCRVGLGMARPAYRRTQDGGLRRRPGIARHAGGRGGAVSWEGRLIACARPGQGWARVHHSGAIEPPPSVANRGRRTGLLLAGIAMGVFVVIQLGSAAFAFPTLLFLPFADSGSLLPIEPTVSLGRRSSSFKASRVEPNSNSRITPGLCSATTGAIPMAGPIRVGSREYGNAHWSGHPDD